MKTALLTLFTTFVLLTGAANANESNEATLGALQKLDTCVSATQKTTPDWENCLKQAQTDNQTANWILSRIQTCYDFKYVVWLKDADGNIRTAEDLAGCNPLARKILLQNLLQREIEQLPQA